MAQTGYTPILIYSSSTAAAAPSAGDLTNSTLGSELAINITDGKLFYKDNANAVQVIGWKVVPTSAGGTGLTSFTANQVFYASSTSAIGQSANLTFNGTTLTANDITDSSLTSGRVTYAGTGGNLVDSANLTFNGTTLTTTGINNTGNTTLGDATTDTVTINGYVGVGGAANASYAIQVTSSALTGLGQIGVFSNPTITSAATTGGYGYYAKVNTAAATFTVADVFAYRAVNATKGAGSTITTQYGVYVDDQTQGTNNFGIRLLVSSGANKWNIYASGTAANYFAGQSQFANGAVGTPSISNINDTNTGIFFPAADTVAIATNGTEDIRFFSSGGVSIGDTTDPGAGNLRLGTGNLVIGTSGKGIDFSATPGTGTSELLADYEEGTFTPSLVPGTSGSITLTTAQAKYTKVGRAVTVTGICEVASVSLPVGTLLLQGLPFTNSADASSRSAAAIYATGLAAGATTSIVGRIIPSESQIRIEKYAAGTASALAGDVQTNTLIQFCLTYFV